MTRLEAIRARLREIDMFPDLPFDILSAPCRERWLLERVNELSEALRTLNDRITDGTLVRDISRDAEPGWAMRVVPLVLLLKRTEQALAALDAPEGT